MNNYTVYHLHSDLSLLDSCTNFQDYVDRAVSEGMTAIASTEHGKPSGWISKKMACDKAGIKFIHGVEIYMTEQLEPKVADNYHTVLLAKNEDGIHELNKLIELSTREDHTYYKNRITFDEFLNISPNIIKTSACLASPLWKLPELHPYYKKLLRHYDYLEVQPWNIEDQIAFNKRLLKYSRQYNIPLIAGTDTHSLSVYKAECRDVIMWRKEQYYSGEETMHLRWFTYDELLEAFAEQGALPKSAYLDAIENTNVMADSVEDFKLDRSFKYPICTESHEMDSEVYSKLVWEKLDEKLKAGIIPPEQEAGFRKALTEELAAFKKVGMDGFMLSMSRILSYCRDNDIYIGPGRGSVGGSRAAYVTDITDTNSETWDTSFSRFCNENRVVLPDIDTDVVDTDRPKIFEHVIEMFGAKKTARVASYGTIKDLAFIDDVGGGLANKWEYEHNPDKFNDSRRMKIKNDFAVNNPYTLARIKKIKDAFKADPDQAKQDYPDLFYYYDGIVGTRISQSVHPAGMIISPIDLDESYGVFHKDGERCLLLDMDEAHDVGLLKYDFLILKTVTVIRDAYAMLGKKPPRMHEIDFNDQKVWKAISADATSIFQFESEFSADAIQKYKPKSIYDMALVTAVLRPACASFRDQLLAHVPNHNPSEIIDRILSKSLNYLVFQEQIISFLQEICGMSGADADSVRRSIGKKDHEAIEKALPVILDGYCSHSDKPREQAEAECKQFLQVIQDAGSYSFNYSHAVEYSLLSYICGYLRTYHPLQYIASYLKNAANDDDIITGQHMALRYGIKFSHPKFGQNNATFFADTATNEISSSITAIKGIGVKDADALYDLAQNNTYFDFVDLMYDMFMYPNALNATTIDKLIRCDYFRDFGKIGKLLKIADEFSNGKSRITKSLVPASVEKRMNELRAMETTLPDDDIPLMDRIKNEVELLGQPLTIIPEKQNAYAVLAVDDKYSPKLSLYSISRGTTGVMKMLKPYYKKTKVEVGTIFTLEKWHKAPTYYYSEGQRMTKGNSFDLWIDEIKIM